MHFHLWKLPITSEFAHTQTLGFSLVSSQCLKDLLNGETHHQLHSIRTLHGLSWETHSQFGITLVEGCRSMYPMHATLCIGPRWRYAACIHSLLLIDYIASAPLTC